MDNVLSSTRNSEHNKDLSEMFKTLDAECRNCAPTSPLECITRCQVYNLQNDLTNTLGSFPEFAEMLPAHSECYEETVLRALMTGPKTFEEIETLISSKIA